VLAATRYAMKRLAVRLRALDAQIKDLDRQLTPPVTATAPKVVALRGVGIHTTATLLVTAGDNPDRLRSARGVRAAHWHRPDPCFVREDRPVPALARQ
jgi:transposase